LIIPNPAEKNAETEIPARTSDSRSLFFVIFDKNIVRVMEIIPKINARI
jgi:hypothetical protein